MAVLRPVPSTSPLAPSVAHRRGSAIHGSLAAGAAGDRRHGGAPVLGAVLTAWLLGFDTAAGVTVLLIGLGLPLLAAEYFFEGVGRSFGWFGLATVPVYLVRPLLIGGLCLGLAPFGVELTLSVIGAVLLVAMALVTAGGERAGGGTAGGGGPAGMAVGMAVRSALLGWLVWRLERIRVWSVAVPRLRAA